MLSITSAMLLGAGETSQAYISPAEGLRTIFVSRSDDSLSIRDIAALEGVRAKHITGEWLAAHSEYGSSPDLALSERAALRLWREIAPDDADASSNWLVLERGYIYEDLGRLIGAPSRTQPKTDPAYVSTYGDSPEISLSEMIVMPDSRTTHVQFEQVSTAFASQSAIVTLDQTQTGLVAPAEGLRTIFVSRSDDSLSIRDIAALEGVRAKHITGEWLAAHSEYGSSPDLALSERAALRLWREIAPDDADASSNWLVLERGYIYEDLGRLIGAPSRTQPKTDPAYVSTYGDSPEISLSEMIVMPDSRTTHVQFEHTGITQVNETDVPAEPSEPREETSETPAPDPEPEPGPTDPIVVPDPLPAEQPDNVVTPTATAIELDGGQTDVMGGRVTTLIPEGLGEGSTVNVLSHPAHGNVTVNPDNSLALVMTSSDYKGPMSFSYEVIFADGSSQPHQASLNVTQAVSEGGWGTGADHYMLQTDADNNVVVEHGDNHRKLYISNSDDALSLRDIAILEGLQESDVTQKWLAANGDEYGASADMALKEDAGMRLWATVTGGEAEPSSNWLLFERGYTYDDARGIVKPGTHGESELHPVLISSYGTGEKPIITTKIGVSQHESSNIVIQDIDLHDSGFSALLGENLLLDGIAFKHAELNVQKVEGFTLRESSVIDAFHEEPVNSGDTWDQSANRTGGMFGKANTGVLIENTLWDHNGWADGFDFYRSADDPQPPSFYSHNVYLQYDNLDVTFRDNISMRAASFGAQIRSGGFIEDNLLLDNNAALVFHGGDYKGSGDIGNYSLLSGNVVTSGQHLTVDSKTGATAGGIDNRAALTSLVNNIVAHVANPDDPSELEYKILSQSGLKNIEDPFFDNTMVFNWVGQKHLETKFDERNRNVDDLDWDVLYDTTIQNFTGQLLGKEAGSIEELVTILRAQAAGKLDHVVDADLVATYFRIGFGIDVETREGAQTLRFVPDGLGDGVRWDNRMNWDTDDFPGASDGDSVDLAGNWVQYGGTTTLADLTFGDGGKLNVTHGYLKVEGDVSVGGEAAELSIDESGQVWISGYTDTAELTVNVAGGRFANIGEVTGTVDLNVSGNAQVILATDDAAFNSNEHSKLHITGGNAKVGFDGLFGGTAVLRLHDDATLGLIAEYGEIGLIQEFRSGHFDQDAPDVLSGINLGGSTLHIDVSGLGVGSHSDVLIDVDELIGTFGEVDLIGLGSGRDAWIGIDYENDRVTLDISQAGSGLVTLNAFGDMYNAQNAPELWDALTM